MASNANNEYRIFKYYEGMCASGNFPKELAKVLALGVQKDALVDIDGNPLGDPMILQEKNWDIVYPAPDSSLRIDQDLASGGLTAERYKEKILNQVAKISDTVILRTETTPKDMEAVYDNLTVDPDSNKESLVMYLEIYKPTYLANPEEYPLDCERRGITPQCITKDMYIQSYKNTKAVEESLYLDTKCSMVISDDTSVGSITLDQATCDKYVMQLQDVFGDLGIIMAPTTIGQTSSVKIETDYLSKIQQSAADLYNFIINTLNNGEGIEPKTYSILEYVTMSITKDTNETYEIILESSRKLKTYTILNNTKISLKNTPVTEIIPEFYMDGIYIPLDKERYAMESGNTIKFLDDIVFEASSDGVLVVRYEYATGSDQKVITERATLLNNHYMLMRLFDNINDEGTGPAENVYNANGDIIQTNSHVSPWAKLSWYKDFEELMVDTLDTDISVNQIHDGTVLVPLETPGLNADTKLRYWINTNNDRFSMIVMGNPSLDYTKERHLISACYAGRIDSFEHSMNDTAGNFSLFTSSSTEPCNTKLTIEKMENEPSDYVLTEKEVKDNSYNADKLNELLSQEAEGLICKKVQYNSSSNGQYNVVLDENLYFSRDVWPKYIVVDSSGNPVTGLTQAFKRNFIIEDGKASTVVITLQADHQGFDNTYTVYVTFGSYREKYHITSGVTRDVFGNVVDVSKVDDYGINTSDGVTSIMMYHTRSKAYYQRHHMLFATTEEYMSKVMYGKSSYTGEYYADRIKVTHGNDGPRGTMCDILVIDSSSLYAMDELVINKDFEKEPDEMEETFIYFPVTAPFSPLSDSPNSRYGFAIKKEEREPAYEDEVKLLKIAIDELGYIARGGWDPTDKDIYPPDVTSNGCKVYWDILDGTGTKEDTKVKYDGETSTPSEYCPVKLAVIQTSQYQGEETKLMPLHDVVITSGTNKADKTYAQIKLNNFSPVSDDIVMYGICTKEEADELEKGIGTNAYIKVTLKDEAVDNPGTFIYNVDKVPSTGEITAASIDGSTDITIEDADPDKYLVLYSVTHDTTSGAEKDTVSKFAITPLKNSTGNRHDLLQYPCSVTVSFDNGSGTFKCGDAVNKYVIQTVTYGDNLDIEIIPAEGYEVYRIGTEDPDVDASISYETGPFETVNGKPGIKLTNIQHDYKITVTLQPTAS